MSKKPAQKGKKKELTEEQKLNRELRIAEKKARVAREEAQRKERERSKNLMMSAMGAILLSTGMIIVAGVMNNAYSNLVELFAYGFTAVGGFALILSGKNLEKSSKRWIMIAGIVAIFIGVLSFLVQAMGLMG